MEKKKRRKEGGLDFSFLSFFADLLPVFVSDFDRFFCVGSDTFSGFSGSCEFFPT